MPSPARSLSARLLVMTILFVMLGEVLIYVPSIARFRLTYLQERLAQADLATLALDAAPNGVISPDLAKALLVRAGVGSVSLRRPAASYLMLGEPPPALDASYDLKAPSSWELVRDAFAVLGQTDARTIRVMGPARINPETMVDVTLAESEMRTEMLDFSWRILTLSIVISLVTAALVYISLHWLMVRPMRRITAGLVAFREAPEDASREVTASRRGDEIGIVESEFAEMQQSLRAALRQKTRLAALGEAVGKIHHDLRNILSSAVLVSDRLSMSEHPEVRKQTPLLMQAIDRAVTLCQQTLDFARTREPEIKPSRFPLAPLVADVGASLPPAAQGQLAWHNRVGPDLMVTADRDQLFRVILNLGRNAADAMNGGEILIDAHENNGRVAVDIADTGPGLPEAARARLFKPFAGSARGTGLGLAISQEIMRAHGGDISLVKSDQNGTLFRLELPVH